MVLSLPDFFLKKKIKTQHDKQTKEKQLQLYPSKNYYPLVSNLNGVPFLDVSLTLCENILHCIYNVRVLLFTSYYYKVLLFAVLHQTWKTVRVEIGQSMCPSQCLTLSMGAANVHQKDF